MNKIVLTGIIMPVFSLLIACQAIAVLPEAEKVRITKTEPGEECIFLGDVTGSQGNSWTGEFTLNSNLETGARNDLKNNAYALGGDTVYILTERSGAQGEWVQHNTTFSGNVYKCH